MDGGWAGLCGMGGAGGGGAAVNVSEVHVYDDAVNADHELCVKFMTFGGPSRDVN